MAQQIVFPAPTFGSLVRASRRSLARTLASGVEPTLADVVGWEYRGWNANPLSALVLARKFRKGFSKEWGSGPEEAAGPIGAARPGGAEPRGGRVPEDAVEAGAWGYNLLVRPGTRWLPLTGRRILPFRVEPAARLVRPAHPRALALVYAGWPGYGRWNPARYVVDYVVHPHAGCTDLLLGAAYLSLGPVHLFLEHFVLERWQRVEPGTGSDGAAGRSPAGGGADGRAEGAGSETADASARRTVWPGIRWSGGPVLVPPRRRGRRVPENPVPLGLTGRRPPGAPGP